MNKYNVYINNQLVEENVELSQADAYHKAYHDGAVCVKVEEDN